MGTWIRYWGGGDLLWTHHLRSSSCWLTTSALRILTSSTGRSFDESVSTWPIRFTTDIPWQMRPKMACFPSSHYKRQTSLLCTVSRRMHAVVCKVHCSSAIHMRHQQCNTIKWPLVARVIDDTYTINIWKLYTKEKLSSMLLCLNNKEKKLKTVSSKNQWTILLPGHLLNYWTGFLSFNFQQNCKM